MSSIASPAASEPKINPRNDGKPSKINSESGYSWRKILYKGVDFLHAPFNEPIFLIAELTAAIAIQSFSARGMPPGIAKSMSFSGGIINPLKSALFKGPLSFCLGLLLTTTSKIVYKTLGISDAGPDRALLDSAFKEIPKNIKKKQRTIEICKKNMGIIKRAATTAFFEEVCSRFLIQGTLTSLAELTGFSNLRTVQAVSSALFGLLHAKQSISQAISAGVTSYYFEARLYEEQGLLSAVAVHFMNNAIAHSLVKALS